MKYILILGQIQTIFVYWGCCTLGIDKTVGAQRGRGCGLSFEPLTDRFKQADLCNHWMGIRCKRRRQFRAICQIFTGANDPNKRVQFE